MRHPYLLVAAAFALAIPATAFLMVLRAFLDASSESTRTKVALLAADITIAGLRADLHEARLLQCLPTVSYKAPEFPIPGLEARQSKLVTPSALRGEVSGA